jgi:branched-chain amino acid transport system substrate-binding protein
MATRTKIGLLLPQSKQYKTLDRDFIRGLKLNDLEVTFSIESIGLGADEKLIIDKIQKLHYQEEVTIIIGFFGHHKLLDVFEYATSHDLLLIASDLGATLPYGMPKLKGVYCNSYGLHESSFLLGKHLSQLGYKTLATSTSYYDSGYGLLSALEHAFEQSDTTFSGHYITPFLPRENESICMQETIKALNPDAVFAFHSGLYAQEHSAFLLDNQLHQKYPFYLTPFSIDKELLENNLKHPFYVVGSWIENFDNGNEKFNSNINDKLNTNINGDFSDNEDNLNGEKANLYFSEKYKDRHEVNPSLFSLLGYENGLILKEIVKKTTNCHSIIDLIETANNLQIAGPRGMIQFDLQTNRTTFNHYIYKVDFDTKQLYTIKKETTLQNKEGFIGQIMNQELPMQAGGWQNAYGCH